MTNVIYCTLSGKDKKLVRYFHKILITNTVQ